MNRGELLEQLKHVDETLLLELLEISSEDIVDAFAERIEEYEYRIRKELEENI